jgi:lysophospholipid acyltransferase (LPLAT)-like uncharacterized protein
MAFFYRLFGKLDRTFELKPPGNLPRDYHGLFPVPPHVGIKKKNDTYKYLKDLNPPKKANWKKKLLVIVLSFVLRKAIEFIHWSCPLVKFFIHPETQKIIRDPKGQFIIALWHNRLFYTVYSLNCKVASYGHDVLAIISDSDDAEFIALSTEAWGAYCVRGSSTRKGFSAMKKILKVVKHHFHPLITPDGPLGPVYKVKDGLVILAKLTGLPIVCMCYDAEKKWILKSWDGFIIPKPFSKVVLEYAEPILIDRDMNIKDACEMLDEKMKSQVCKLEKALKELC